MTDTPSQEVLDVALSIEVACAIARIEGLLHDRLRTMVPAEREYIFGPLFEAAKRLHSGERNP